MSERSKIIARKTGRCAADSARQDQFAFPVLEYAIGKNRESRGSAMTGCPYYQTPDLPDTEKCRDNRHDYRLSGGRFCKPCGSCGRDLGRKPGKDMGGAGQSGLMGFDSPSEKPPKCRCGACKVRECPRDGAGPHASQPMPICGSIAVLPLVISDLQKRSEIGAKKYGTVLKTCNGRDALVDAYQEILDAAMYLRQRIEEGRAAGLPDSPARGKSAAVGPKENRGGVSPGPTSRLFPPSW